MDVLWILFFLGKDLGLVCAVLFSFYGDIWDWCLKRMMLATVNPNPCLCFHIAFICFYSIGLTPISLKSTQMECILFWLGYQPPSHFPQIPTAGLTDIEPTSQDFPVTRPLDQNAK